jgi:outer membrane protein assembly factor BamE
MQKLLISWVLGASLLLSGCSSGKDPYAPNRSILDRLPLVYRPDIQQGNVLDQEVINRLQPDLAKSQANYLMGTPLLVDVFHRNRWDYIYSIRQGNQPREQQRISLFFEDDRLVRIEGDLRPQPSAEITLPSVGEVFTVTDYKERQKGFFTRLFEKIFVIPGPEK